MIITIKYFKNINFFKYLWLVLCQNKKMEYRFLIKELNKNWFKMFKQWLKSEYSVI